MAGNLLATVRQKCVVASAVGGQKPDFVEELRIFDQEIIFHVPHHVVLLGLFDGAPRSQHGHAGAIGHGCADQLHAITGGELIHQGCCRVGEHLNGEIHPHLALKLAGDHRFVQAQ